MTFALTKVQAYGIEAEEPLNKRYRQYMYLTYTAANTDTALDLGSNQTGSLGTFWTAVSGTAPGSGALTALQDIVTRAECGQSPMLSTFNFYQGAAASGVVYTVAVSNKTPNVAFASGSAPTSCEVCLTWILQPQTAPVAYEAST